MVEAEQSATDRAVEPISQQEEIERLTRTGLRIAGAVGLVLALLLIAVYTLAFNLPIAWVGRRDISTAIWDEGAVALLGGLLIAAARSPRLVRSGRLLFAIAIWLAGFVVLFDDAMHHGQLQSTGYLALLVLAAVGLMPYRRAEMLGIGAGLVVVATGLTLGLSLRLNPELLIFLGVLTILGAWISGALWESRTQRVEWLRMTAMSEERYRSLFRDASDAIFTIDNATGRFQEVNPALERLLGESSARLRQRQFHEIIHPEDRERVSGYHRARISGDEAPNHYQARIVAPTTGAIHFCEITIHRLSRPGLTAGIARDLTERIKAEQTIREYAAELEKSNREIVATQTRLVQAEKTAAMAGLVAGVVHELNSPLAAIQCNVDVAARSAAQIANAEEPEGESSAEVRARLHKNLDVLREVCSAAKGGIRRISEVVRMLRSYAHLDQAERQMVDINAVIGTVLQLLRYQIGEQIKVNCRLAPLPEFECDARDLTQMVEVFLRYAINGAGARGTVTVTTMVNTKALEIAFHSSGGELSPEEKLRLFDPHFSIQSQRVGLGLELPIAHHVVVAHGGEVEVESAPGQGTRLIVRLPLPERG